MPPPATRPTRLPLLAAGAATAAAAGAALAAVNGRSRRQTRAATLAAAAARSAGERTRLARCLADPARATLLAFYAPDCALCRSIAPDVREIAADEADWLDVVPLNAADGAAWAPEVLHYRIGNAPAFVLLDKDGNATCRTGPPPPPGGEGWEDGGPGLRAREAVLTGLDAMVEAGRPQALGRRGV